MIVAEGAVKTKEEGCHGRKRRPARSRLSLQSYLGGSEIRRGGRFGMGLELSLNYLLEYTEWERGKWREWLGKQGAAALKTSAGANGDGRFHTVGDLIRHMFSAEKRYVDRLSGRALTETSVVPNDEIEALFGFGERSRNDLRDFLGGYPEALWDLPQDHKIVNSVLTVTPRKIVVHILLHEMRHWAQIATLFRLNGLTDDFHDFLFSPVMGGGIRRGSADGSGQG